MPAMQLCQCCDLPPHDRQTCAPVRKACYPVIHFCKFLLLTCFVNCMFTNERHAHAAENVWSYVFHLWNLLNFLFPLLYDLCGCLPFTTSMNPYSNFKYTHPHPTSICACCPLRHKEHLNLVTACFLLLLPHEEVCWCHSLRLAVWTCSEMLTGLIIYDLFNAFYAFNRYVYRFSTSFVYFSVLIVVVVDWWILWWLI